MKLGLSGILTRTFIGSPLTPLLLLAAILMGAVALTALPREEEPQISVPMVDIIVQANGLKAGDAAELVTKPLEDIVKGIPGVEHVYSETNDDQVVVTARFYVGTDEDTAVLRVFDHISANYNRIPIGIPKPLIVGRGINDVAILTLTLTPQGPTAGRWDDNGLYKIASELQHELIKVENVGLTYIVGGRPDQIRVEPNPEKLSLYGVTLNQLVDKVRNANRSFETGTVLEKGRSLPAVAGQTLQGVADIGNLLLTTYDGRPVYVKDVATIVVGAAPEDHQVWDFTRSAHGVESRPAVTLALAKRKGTNAVVVADQLLSRLKQIEGRLIPDSVKVTVTRDYGATAQDKANELLLHLALATVTIVGLIAVFIGWREALVVLVVVPATILLTFFASWLLGYTINRVSLFALIFSIGILVDDAIVVVENIVRRWQLEPKGDRVDVAVRAVAEVGNPTIIATLTIIAALLPMMFVSGLMGPYMSPIPANASAAMLFSFFIAVVVAPWLLIRLGRHPHADGSGHGEAGGLSGLLVRFYRRVAPPVLKTRRRAGLFLLVTGIATVAVCGLFYTENVTAKLLPFDNKSEMQVVANLPRGTSLQETNRVLTEAARRLIALPEVTSIQSYAGTSAPFNFNGLVRHYYLRNQPYQGDLQVNLLPKGDRSRSSHEIALDVRNRLKGLAVPPHSSIQVVEVPPGPPVLATLLAEIYGPDAHTRREVARKVRQIFERVPFIVDVDDSFGVPADRLRFQIDQDSLEFYGVEQQAVYDTIAGLIGGTGVGYSHRGDGIYPIEIAVRLPKSELVPDERLLSTPVPARHGTVELGDLVTLVHEPLSYPIYRRDGHDAEMVTGDLAGQFEAPIYGMIAVDRAIAKIKAADWGPAGPPAISLHGQPTNESKPTLLWDGEWEITYVTFRDMGIAFGVAIVAIYLLIVGEFRSFRLPLVIMTPIPLTLIGIVLGHWLFHAPFTATSMIGFISLAGIIVRNSILLVDFIRHEQAKGLPLRTCLVNAGATRFRPILLTALAAMVGAAFILPDPIFQGLAISLLFGLASSTALTLLVIPAIYVLLRDDGRPPESAP